MNGNSPILLLVGLAVLSLGGLGCKSIPGKPLPNSEAKRPDQILDLPTLYQQNCSACHGAEGKGGAAIALANPAYLAFAGVANIEHVTSLGVPGTSMPGFGPGAGGVLTDQQVHVLATAMVSAWGNNAPASTIAYTASGPGDPAHGASAFTAQCASCHGADGTGLSSQHTGSLVDPAYLALISNQGLRSFIIAGHASPIAIGDPELNDIVAWLASHRTPLPGQPYMQHQ